MHSTNTTNFIGTQKSVYRDLPIGKLEKFKCDSLNRSPLQQGFNSNRQTSFSITIDNLSAFFTGIGAGLGIPLGNKIYKMVEDHQQKLRQQYLNLNNKGKQT